MNNSRLSNLTKHIRRCVCAPWIIPLLVALALPASVQAQFTYVTNNGSITITGYTGLGGDVTIPDTISGYPVTSIGDGAFVSCNMTSIMIPSSVTNIGRAAFQNCGALTDISIPDSVTSIGDWAFCNCSGLTSVTLPISVTTIGEADFNACTKLANIAIPNSVTSIGQLAFWMCGLTSVTIPNSITNIGGGAFGHCRSLTNITVDALNHFYCSVDGILFDHSQTTLIQYAGPGQGCYTVPGGVITIGNGAFAGTGFTGVTIPNSVTTIGSAAFQQCSRLSTVSIPSSVTNIKGAAFESCRSLRNVTIPERVTTIEGNTFYGCSSLANVTIPDSVTVIEFYAFSWCSSFTNVLIGRGVTDIGDSAFRSCSSLLGIYFSGNAPSLGSTNVFSGDNRPTVYYLPGTTGWGPTYGGRPTALWPPPTTLTPPQTQTAEAGAAAGFSVRAISVGDLPLSYQWFFNGASCLGCTNSVLQLAGVQYSQAGAYTVIVTNAAGSVTSPPALLSVVAPVDRRIVPALTLMGQPGTSLNLDFTAALGPAQLWTTFDHVPLTAASQWYFDLSSPLPPQGFYRAWQSSAGTPPVVNLHFVPALTLAGAIGSSQRVDYLNQFGPIDAWGTLDTITLTNTSQLYFDTSVIGQPARLYRVVPLP